MCKRSINEVFSFSIFLFLALTCGRKGTPTTQSIPVPAVVAVFQGQETARACPASDQTSLLWNMLGTPLSPFPWCPGPGIPVLSNA